MAQGFYKWLFVGVTTVVLTYLNYRGLEIVGKSAIVICILSLLPFIIFVIVGAFQVDPSKYEGGNIGDALPLHIGALIQTHARGEIFTGTGGSTCLRAALPTWSGPST
jgi:amino acid transporter